MARHAQRAQSADFLHALQASLQRLGSPDQDRIGVRVRSDANSASPRLALLAEDRCQQLGQIGRVLPCMSARLLVEAPTAFLHESWALSIGGRLAPFQAAEEGVPVQMKHLKDSARFEYTKLEKTLTPVETRGW